MKHQCESLYAQGHINDAVGSLLEMEHTIDEGVRANKLIIDWLAGELRCRAVEQSIHSLPSEFTHRYITALQRMGDVVSDADKRDEAVTAYSITSPLTPSNPNSVLTEWARIMLIGGSAHETLSAAVKVLFPH